ncbi:MAG: endonuclease/exonuclease/phosphatase family protein [Bacteroidetes bacterium]|nr:endonuclease/exonuclease/phosphatase family protein [Bacteroidota bacterium]
MKIVSWNIGEYGKRCNTFPIKFRVLRDLIRTENADVFCIIEGTQSQKHNRLLKYLFKLENYTCYYDPSIPKKRNDEFDWNDYDTYGIKIFINNTSNFGIPNLDPSTVLFKGRLLKLEINNYLFVFLHRNRSAENYDQDQYMRQIKRWVTSRQKDRIKNVYIIGDFNLSIWDEKYFSEKSGYIRTSVIYRQYELRVKENSGIDFFNPIIEVINKKNQLNLGGTYYGNKKYGWAILDYILVKNWGDNTTSIDILTSSENYELINSNENTNKYINHNFDHLPIKLQIS